MVVLWAYRTMTKKLHKYTLYQLVHGKDVVIPAEFITPRLYNVHVTHMTNDESIVKQVTELLELD
jgi:hypothetical protein